MRIAYLVNQYPTVSHTFIRREVLALERQGFDVMRIALRHWDGELLNPIDRLEYKQTRFVLRQGALALLLATLRSLVTRPAGFFKALSLALRMSRRSERPFPVHLVYLAEACCVEPWLREGRVEHLHAHFGTNSAAVAMLVHELGGPPWSFTVHGPDEFDRPQFIGLPEKIRRSAFVAGVSSYGRGQLCRWVEYKHWHKVKEVHCALGAEHFEAPSTPSQPAKRLLSIGRLTGAKGQSLLVEAAARLKAAGTDFELVLAGDGELRGELETLIVHHGLQSSVRITGWISDAQVREEILAARALVSASFAEGLPVVFMEAMALHRPVIGTYVAGIPELIVPGEHGWLVPAGNVDALVDAISACLNAPVEVLEQMGNAAHARVKDRHNVDTEAKKLAALFKSHASPASAGR